jgi:hypothetical protein
VSKEFSDIWVPIIYDGVITLDEKEVVLYEDAEKGIRKTKIDFILPEYIVKMCKGMETVSGKQLHIREGCNQTLY